MGSSMPASAASRIGPSAFVGSTVALFIIGVLAISARLFIKLRLQRSLAIEDASLLCGFGFLVCAKAILFVFKDDMYLVEAMLLHTTQTINPMDLVQRTLANQKWVTIALELLWMAIVAVKLSFLLFFRKFVGSSRRLVTYWWIVAGFNLIVFCYGVASYVAPCSRSSSTQSGGCGHGDSMRLIVNFAIAQVVMDIAGDIMILAIPVCLWWNVKVHWDQKIPTLVALCLALFITIFKMIRPAAMGTAKDVADLTWSLYWQYIVAEVGVILAAMAAYRTVIVPDGVDETGSRWQAPFQFRHTPRSGSEKRALIWGLRTSSIWRSRSGQSSAATSTTRLDTRGLVPKSELMQPEQTCARKARPLVLTHGFDFGFDRLVHGCPVPNTPRRTGIRTFIAGPGSRSRPASHVVADASRANGVFADSGRGRGSGYWNYPSDGIKVEQGIESYSIHVRGSQELTRNSNEEVAGVPELPETCVPRSGTASRAEVAEQQCVEHAEGLASGKMESGDVQSVKMPSREMHSGDIAISEREGGKPDREGSDKDAEAHADSVDRKREEANERDGGAMQDA